jgi:hypothetical protein
MRANSEILLCLCTLPGFYTLERLSMGHSTDASTSTCRVLCCSRQRQRFVVARHGRSRRCLGRLQPTGLRTKFDAGSAAGVAPRLIDFAVTIHQGTGDGILIEFSERCPRAAPPTCKTAWLSSKWACRLTAASSSSTVLRQARLSLMRMQYEAQRRREAGDRDDAAKPKCDEPADLMQGGHQVRAISDNGHPPAPFHGTPNS